MNSATEVDSVALCSVVFLYINIFIIEHSSNHIGSMCGAKRLGNRSSMFRLTEVPGNPQLGRLRRASPSIQCSCIGTGVLNSHTE